MAVLTKVRRMANFIETRQLWGERESFSPWGNEKYLRLWVPCPYQKDVRMMVVATCQHLQEIPGTPKEGVGGEKAPAICDMENEPESWCLVSISMTLFCIFLICQNMIPTKPHIRGK